MSLILIEATIFGYYLYYIIMKRLLYWAFIISICLSCNSLTDKNTERILDSIGNASAKNEAWKKKFDPIITGMWENEDFMNKFQTRLLTASDTINPYIIGLNIEHDFLQNGRLILWANFSDRKEGEYIPFDMDPDRKPNRVAFTPKYELGYHVSQTETILYLFYEEEGKAKVIKFNKIFNNP